MHETEKQILRFLKKAQVRQKLCIFLTGLGQSICASLFFVIVIEIFSKFIPMYYKSLYQVVAVILSLFIYTLINFSKKQDLKQIALLIDSFGLKERVTTSLELFGVEDEFSKYVKQTAAQMIKNVDIKKMIKPRFEKRKWILVLMFFTVFFALTNIHTSKMAEAKRLHDLNVLKKKEMAKIEKIKKDIFKAYNLNKAEKRKIEQVVLKIKKEIKNAKNKNDLEIVKQKAGFLLDSAKENSKNLQLNFALEKLKKSVLQNSRSNEEKKKSSTIVVSDNANRNQKSSNTGKGDAGKISNFVSKGQDTEKEDINLAENSETDKKSSQEKEQLSSNSQGESSVEGSNNQNSAAAQSGGQNRLQAGNGGINGSDNLTRGSSGLGASVPKTSRKIEKPSVYTKELAEIEASKKVLAATSKENGKTVQRQGTGERGQKLAYDKVFSQYKQEANEYIEADEVPSWAKEITKRYFENLENTR